MCVFTDGYNSKLEVINTRDLYQAALELFNNYNPAKHLHLMQTLGNSYNATEIAQGITSALHGEETYKWFID